jgi:mannose-6-phosphate isomerase-like protein (cupin superfamily)
MEPIRRVVTGHDAAGRSVVLLDGQVRPSAELPTDVALWSTAESPARNLGDDDAARRVDRLEPVRAGSIFRFVELPPDSAFAGMSPDQVEQIVAGLFDKLGAAHARTDTRRAPTMHRTKTIDYLVVLSGEVTLILDGTEVTLKPFDVVVQRGTSHGWSNRGAVPALLAVAMLDAEPAR